ncbi:hypothetical protein DYB32_006438 [Aphanomyces invadans]|uniref:SAC domain-containing protein n=1 Tax=Aphanomyces invadans TaxID=157072 RepID=A0A3R6VV16_9STRA|nr:hypothetical protein DYB32_006438 [Aphanomyces invadans]
MSASRSTSTGRFELHVLSDLTHLAISQKGNEQCLLVNRNAANTTSGVVLEDVSELNHAHGRSLKFDAIFGIYTLLRGKYLALVTESRSVGKFKVRGADVDIRQVTGIEMVLLPTQQLPHLTPTQMEDEERYMAMITNDVEAQLLYFAFDYDLTHTLQRMTTSLSPTVSIAERADPRFCWNYPACSFLLEKKLFAWVVPIMQGYVEVCKNVSIGANKTVYQRQELEKDTAAFQLHAEELMKLYGRVILVNLIDKKTEQLKLGEAFEKTFANASALNTHILANIRYFSKSATGQVTSTQSGVVRTNCMDNLDRTNVVQSLFARRSLLLQVGESVQGNVLTSPFDSFEKTFKNVWGNNADAISFLYAGTGALKTDFTRTGKRTTRGALQDGYNSVLRYILNNFYDGHRQDAMDLLLLRYVPSRHKGSPFVAASSLVCKLCLLIVTGMLLAAHNDLTHLFNRLLHATGTVVAALAFTFGYFVRRGTKLAIANRPAPAIMLAVRRAAARVQVSAFSAAVPSRSFSDKFADKERAEEARYFNKEDERALRKLLAKLKGQADAADAAGAQTQESIEKKELAQILGANASPATIEALIKWKHHHH